MKVVKGQNKPTIKTNEYGLQNTAFVGDYNYYRLIMRKRKYDRITSTLRDDFHWLPTRQRILFKLSTIVYKCIHEAAPSYLTNLCVPVATNTSRRYLRSATHGDLQVSRTRTVTYTKITLYLNRKFTKISSW